MENYIFLALSIGNHDNACFPVKRIKYFPNDNTKYGIVNPRHVMQCIYILLFRVLSTGKKMDKRHRQSEPIIP